MIKNVRHKRILKLLENEGAVEIRALSAVIPGVSEVTLRRDIVELAQAGALKRTRGGALPAAAAGVPRIPSDPKPDDAGPNRFPDAFDAVILPYIPGRDGETLRRRIIRRGIPFLAESTQQPGGVYLGPDNRGASRDLGTLAAGMLRRGVPIRLLVVGQPDLSNTADRVEGFIDGLRAHVSSPVEVASVDGQGSYRVALQAVLDAFAIGDGFDVIFAVNDHSTVAAIEASERMDVRPLVFATGGESGDLVAQVSDDGSPLVAVAAFFPEVVGSIAVDVIAAAFDGGNMPDRIVTPHALITADSLTDYYETGPSGWMLKPERYAEFANVSGHPKRASVTRSIGFMPHYPAHDWYRTMAQALQARAIAYGHNLIVTAPHEGVAREISRIRREIAESAVATLCPGETIILGAGDATRAMAEVIANDARDGAERVRNLTVVTNALDVLERLQSAPGVKTILTSGEFQASDRCLVGPSLSALFEQLRADRAFLAVDGITPEFGPSISDERLALAASRLMAASDTAVVLVDHACVGANATYRVARIGNVQTVITDDGALPADRQALRLAGINVIIAGDYSAHNTASMPTDTARWTFTQPQRESLGGL